MATPKFKLRQEVKLLSSMKSDGSYNYGRIMGIEIQQNGFYLGYANKSEFFARFDGSMVNYKVAYIDCVTQRAETLWLSQDKLEKKQKK